MVGDREHTEFRNLRVSVLATGKTTGGADGGAVVQGHLYPKATKQRHLQRRILHVDLKGEPPTPCSSESSRMNACSFTITDISYLVQGRAYPSSSKHSRRFYGF